jgi:hypothetical protein
MPIPCLWDGLSWLLAYAAPFVPVVVVDRAIIIRAAVLSHGGFCQAFVKKRLMKLDPESLYRQLGRIIETMPDLSQAGPLPLNALQWLGRAHALVAESESPFDAIDWRSAVQTLDGPWRSSSVQTMMQVLYRVMAVAELKAPASARGSFIPVGASFDAFAALSKVIQTGTKDVLIVDPYMDYTALTEFGSAVSANVTLRLLADEATYKTTLGPAAERWSAQYGATRPLGVRLAAPKALHDRAIFIDQTTAWTLTQSLKDFAKRSPAEIVRADDVAALKIASYEAIWASSRIVV